MKGSVIIKDNLTPVLNSIKKDLDRLPKETHQKFVKETPKRTGNARQKTRLNGDVIVADYPYAQKLDDGYSSKAPDGMSEPTEKWLEKKFKDIFRK